MAEEHKAKLEAEAKALRDEQDKRVAEENAQITRTSRNSIRTDLPDGSSAHAAQGRLKPKQVSGVELM
jgi:hypothetical protein